VFHGLSSTLNMRNRRKLIARIQTVLQAKAPGVLLRDTFTDGNAASLDAHTPETGPPWIEDNGNWDIQSNQANRVSGGSSPGAAVASAGVGRSDIELSIQATGILDTAALGAVLRMVDKQNGYIIMIADHVNKFYLIKREGGANSTLQEANATINPATPYTIRSISLGNMLYAILDETTELSANHSFNNTATKIGLWAGKDGDRLDNLVVSPFEPDIFIIAGQSNAMGAGTNNQSYSHATLKAYLLGNDYKLKDMTDPTDVNTNQVDAVSSDGSAAGSPWPLLAASLLAGRKRACVFIPCAKSGSAITNWLPGADHQDRSTLYGSMVYRGLQTGRVKAVLWHQGEADALAAMSQATYNGHLDAIANAIKEDLGCPMMPCKLQDCTGATPSRDVSDVNAAIAEAWVDNNNVIPGPDFSDISPSVDGLHFKTNSELQTAASRWWSALRSAFGW